jgi:hypothetical protein
MRQLRSANSTTTSLPIPMLGKIAGLMATAERCLSHAARMTEPSPGSSASSEQGPLNVKPLHCFSYHRY